MVYLWHKGRTVLTEVPHCSKVIKVLKVALLLIVLVRQTKFQDLSGNKHVCGLKGMLLLLRNNF